MKEEDLNFKMEKAISHLEKEFQSISFGENLKITHFGNVEYI